MILKANFFYQFDLYNMMNEHNNITFL